MAHNLETGNYNVLSFRDGNAINTYPSVAPAEVVILTEVTPVRVTRVQDAPDCTYSIRVSNGHVKPVEEEYFLQAAITLDMPREWIITHHLAEDAYTVVLRDNPILAWTDPGSAPGRNRRV